MRWLLGTAVLVCFLAASGRLQAQDDVVYFDRATQKEATLRGAIQTENPGEIIIKPSGAAARSVPATDVLDVIYNLPFVIKNDYRRARSLEAEAERTTQEERRQKELTSAYQLYRELTPKLTDARAKRQVEFRMARLLGWQAENDPAVVDKAIEQLNQFRRANPDAWQLAACADLLAQLYGAQNNWDAARQAYEELAATPSLAADTRLELELKVAQLLTRAKKFAEAEKKLGRLIQEAQPDSTPALRLRIAQAACTAASGEPGPAAEQLESLVGKTNDPLVKAQAYNTLGDCYRLANRSKDALWSYLWVDVIYHQDRQEHAKALYYLTKLFGELKDEPRAKQFRDKLEKDKQFAGLEYQRLILAGK